MIPCEPPRFHLANLPTPLQYLQRLSDELDVEILCKRDDLTGSAIGGNKVRKLEYLVADASGADTLVTCGGAQSNHCRATALAAAQRGLRSILLLRTEDPSRPPPTEGNILLDRLAGAELRFISRPDYARRAELMRAVCDELARGGRTGYVIPEGGSNAVGAWGYVRAIYELKEQLAAWSWRTRDVDDLTIVYAAGSGGTGAGILVGCRMAGLAARVVGVNVCDDRAYFVREIGRIVTDFQARYGLELGLGDKDVEILDGFVGRGYAQSRPEELALLRDLVRSEGLVLDPVYTGKAMFGLVSEARARPGSLGRRIVFMHTGGIFGLMTAEKAAELGPLL